MSGLKREILLVLGGALLVAVIIVVWALLTSERGAVPHIYPMF